MKRIAAIGVWILAGCAQPDVMSTASSGSNEGARAASETPLPQPGRITLTLRDVTVRDALDAIQRQVASVRLEMDTKGWLDDFRIRQFIVIDEPWPSALRAFACLAEAEMTELAPDRIHFCRPPRWGGGFKSPIKAGAHLDVIARITGANIIVHSSLVDVVAMSLPTVRCTALAAEVLVEMAVLSIPGASLWRDADGIFHVVPSEH